MKIVRIFETEKPSLLSFQFNDCKVDEFDRIFSFLNDVSELYEFFESNKDDLCSGFWGEDITIEQAIEETIEDAEYLENKISELCNQYEQGIGKGLDELFVDLNNGVLCELNPVKAYGSNYKRKSSWLRLYAIRMGENGYIVSGGTIKLTKTMNDRSHTKNELLKFKKGLDFLKENGICDIEGLNNIESL